MRFRRHTNKRTNKQMDIAIAYSRHFCGRSLLALFLLVDAWHVYAHSGVSSAKCEQDANEILTPIIALTAVKSPDKSSELQV